MLSKAASPETAYPSYARFTLGAIEPSVSACIFIFVSSQSFVYACRSTHNVGRKTACRFALFSFARSVAFKPKSPQPFTTQRKFKTATEPRTAFTTPISFYVATASFKNAFAV